MTEPLKVLFLSEGQLGTMMGHVAYDGALRPVLERTPEVEGRFAGLPEQSRLSKALWRQLPGLAERDLDLHTVRWHAVHGAVARRALRDQIEAFNPDVVHIRSHVIAFGALDYMRRIPFAPVVDATVWQWREQGIWRKVRPWSRAMVWPSERRERAVFRRAGIVLAQNRWAEEGVREAAPDANVVHHHPGIDLEYYRPAERRERSKLRVLFVGGRFHAKGGYDLIEALGDRLGRDVELDAVTGEQVPEREGLSVHRLSNNDPRLVELYQQADLLCLPTYGDSNPWVLPEAMACGTPAIATDIGGISEQLGDGSAGVVIPVGDREALRSAVRDLLDDEGRRRELGERGLAYVRERYDARKQIPLLFDLLREVADRPR